MFPLHDENPTLATPFVTYALVALNALVWFFVQGAGSEALLLRSVCDYGLIPGELSGLAPVGTMIPLAPGFDCVVQPSAVNWATPLSSMFLHGGWFHILGNMWFLWVFGNNVEDSMGHGRFVAFYLLCGLAAAAAQAAANPASAVPMVGASGAIGGVMGAYAVLYPKARVHMLLVLGFYVTRAVVPAVVVLGYWFLLQLLGGIPALASEGGGVAFWAHAGGFLAGLALWFLFRAPVLVAAHRRATRGRGS
jgi:membrane associated rhomboid family serine protease